MRNKKMTGILIALAAMAAVSGCSASSEAPASSAPKMALTVLRDPVIEPDATGTIELLSLDDPIDFSYSRSDTDMIFMKKDGVWLDSMDSEIPLNQEKFEAMAQNFLHLKAVAKADAPASPADYGLDHAQYSLNITNNGTGEVIIDIGSQDADGNYYMTMDDENFYLLAPGTVESLVFDYNALVLRDSLDVTVTADQIQSAAVTEDGQTTKYASDDTAAMEKIATGISALKPTVFSTYNANEQELSAAGFTGTSKTTFLAEIDNNGTTESLTVYVGNYADPDDLTCYVMLQDSNMISIVDREVVDDLLNHEDAETATTAAE